MKKKKQIAVCPGCGNPLIMTLHFARAEFFCMKCKATHGFLYEKYVNETPELKAKLKADTKEFNTFANDLYLGGEKIKGCVKCEHDNEPHLRHLTEEELDRCKKARAKIGWI